MPLRVVELFAGVGGFRIGLEGPPGSPRDGKYAVVWSNQWEPSTKKQHAAEVYVERWGLEQSEENPLHYHAEGEVFVNDDIAEVDAKDIPDHDLLVGGFPCQDYSVAKTAKHAAGIEGKKGVLWWEIHRILKEKKPSYVMLENVDRLLKSPTSQRGRDFAVMLASFAELGYIVEWRVINAADYGMPQRRRRVFIMGYAPGTPQYESLKDEGNIKQWMEKDGPFAKAFPINPLNVLFAHPHQIKGPKDKDLVDVSNNFNKGANPKAKSPFKKSGIMVGNNYYTYDTVPKYDGPVTNLSDILLTPGKVPLEYIVEPDSVMKEKGWKYLKGAKDEPRKGTDDFTYQYKEGPMIFPDALDKPSRTIITGEGGSTPSRFKHVVKFKPTKKMKESFDLETKECQAIRAEFGLTKSEWLRRLTPVELERLNMFPDNHTEGPTDGKRAFFMGNALVIGIITKLGNELTENEIESQLEPDTKTNSKNNVFQFLGENLIQMIESNNKDFIWDDTPDIGFTWRSYEGTQAEKDINKILAIKDKEKAKKAFAKIGEKIGLYDIFINTGDRYDNSGVTHRNILREILDNNLIKQVERVWKGEFPKEIGKNIEEIKTLRIFALMMFEQEINWGRRKTEKGQKKIENNWQRFSDYFHPYARKPLKRRPRDMLICYAKWSRDIKSVDKLEYWIKSGGETTLSPSDPSDKFSGIHETLEEYRDALGEEGGEILIQGELKVKFQSIAAGFPENPHYLNAKLELSK